MILGRLITLLIGKGVVLVMTSNYPPDDLYPNGLQRAQFLPAIEILKDELEVVEIGGNRDHRQRILALIPVYHLTIDQASEASAESALLRAFSAMSKAGVNINGVMKIGHRDLPFLRRAKGIVWFEFDSLCVEPRSQMDYLEIAGQYHTVLVSHIPQLHAKNRADVVRRFTWLVDVFYDKRVKLICSAAAAPEWLVVDDRIKSHVRSQASVASNNNGDASLMVAAEFGRTASRLREMQTRDYFSRKHASADNPQVMLIP
jgi:cell division protein ZapE